MLAKAKENEVIELQHKKKKHKIYVFYYNQFITPFFFIATTTLILNIICVQPTENTFIENYQRK